MASEKAKTLSEKEQRKSISFSKSGKCLNRTIRNVLAKPYEGFWPLVSEQVEPELLTSLEQLLPAARKCVSKEDRMHLRKIQGKKLKEARNAFVQEIWNRNPGSLELRDCLAIGINDVSRGLEENKLSSILISNEADPPLLTRHLSTLAATRNVPHLVIRRLKGCVEKCLGFSSLAIGFKTVVAANEENHFHSVHLRIEDEFKSIAKDLIPGSNLLDKSIALPTKPAVATAKPTEPFRSSQEIYLIRSSRKSRIFTPGEEMKVGSDLSWPQYISFSSDHKDKCLDQDARVPQEILGSSSICDTRSFVQKVRDAKKAVNLPDNLKAETDSFISLNEDHDLLEREEKAEPSANPVSKVKPVKRYFTNLAPLKVKRIQGNPKKVTKNQKRKSK